MGDGQGAALWCARAIIAWPVKHLDWLSSMAYMCASNETTDWSSFLAFSDRLRLSLNQITTMRAKDSLCGEWDSADESMQTTYVQVTGMVLVLRTDYVASNTWCKANIWNYRLLRQACSDIISMPVSSHSAPLLKMTTAFWLQLVHTKAWSVTIEVFEDLWDGWAKW